MAETTQTSSPNVDKIVADGDNLDFDALREFSAWETEKESQQAQPKPQPKKKAATQEPSQEEEEETPAEDLEGAEEPDEEGEDDSEDEEDEEVGEEEEESPEPEEKPKKPLKTVRVKDGEKEVDISKTALVPVSIDGKVKEVPLAELTKEYSGNLHFQQESSKLGRERKQFEQDRSKFQREADVINENIQLIHEAAQAGSPEQVVELYAMLTGREPNEVMENLVVNAIKFAKEYSQLTPEQRKMNNELRRLKFQKELTERRANKAAQAQKVQTEQARVLEALKQRGLTNDDWLSAAADLKDKLEAGELENVTPFDVVEHAAKMKRTSQVTEAISQVDESLVENEDFTRRVLAAVIQTEEITRARMKPSEIRRMVQVVREDTQRRFKERLSRKADRARKGSGAISENAKSRKQEETGPLTLSDHFSRISGDGE